MADAIITTTEVWKAIPGYDGRYEASDAGRIRSWVNNQGNRRIVPRIFSPGTTRGGYLLVVLSFNSIVKTFLVHRLVLETFVGLRPEGYECNHINYNRTDNRLENLEWITKKENYDWSAERQKERAPRGDNHYSHTHPEKVAHGDRNGSRTHPEKLARGEQNKMAKLSEIDVIQIRKLAAKGVTYKKIAEKYNVTRCTINFIILRRTWAHVT